MFRSLFHFIHILQGQYKWCFVGSVLFIMPAMLEAASDETLVSFDDAPLEEELVLPGWFNVSFLELEDDLNQAITNGKKGLILYFGQKRCPYCKAHLENNWGKQDILAYTQANFDVVAIDVRSSRPVTDFDGKIYDEKSFSIKHKTNFTPSLLFFVKGNKLALQLRGYRPPYQFRAALEYVADGHFEKEPFSQYMARAEAAFSFGKDKLNYHDLAVAPPFALDRSHIAASRPLMVMFERRKCHACDVLHAEPLHDVRINQLLKKMDVVQLDMQADTPLITPSGEKTTARAWSNTLKLDYAPTLIFFDPNGKEIIRIDSVVWFYRLRNVLTFIETGGYKKYATFQAWRQQHNR